MFNMLDLFKKKPGLTLDEVAELLKTRPECITEFEKAYAAHALSQDVTEKDNLFDVNAKEAASLHAGIEIRPEEMEQMINQIVEELVANTPVWKYDGTQTEVVDRLALPEGTKEITVQDINRFPAEIRPQLTANLMKIDINTPSYLTLLEMYKWSMTQRNEKNRQYCYHHFRQGLDILDLDPITYEIIGTNKNSMGYWLPPLVEAIKRQSFFKVPKTTIIKVPMTMLQLTRCDYMELTRTTLDIVDRFCQKVFELDENKEYFIKTGTYSSKFDFRNACVKGPKEVRELGEYLLFIHYQALQMASPLATPTIYGVSTTNEWVVREFIQDKENNPCIYKGLPLHTEYRVFVDFDTNKVIGVNPYWDPEVMKNRFSKAPDADSPHNKHDYIVYKAHEETLMGRYHENVDNVVKKLTEMLPDVELTGQWSIDIMQNGDAFWIIDMGMAQDSALKECVPVKLLKPKEENWIPQLPESP